jgi:hypothetical protein
VCLRLLSTVVEGAKAVADQKKTISDQDLEALIGEKALNAVEIWELKDLIVSSSSKDNGKFVTSTATVTLHDHEANEEKITSAIGIGPVDAAFKAILKLVARPVARGQRRPCLRGHAHQERGCRRPGRVAVRLPRAPGHHRARGRLGQRARRRQVELGGQRHVRRRPLVLPPACPAPCPTPARALESCLIARFRWL